MNLQVTGEQLRDALITATELRGRIFIRGTVGADGAYGSEHWSEDQIEDLRTILTVLDTLSDDSTDAGEDPAPAHGVLEAASDDWQPTSLDDITMTDEAVLALYADGTGVQGKPHDVSDEVVCIAVNGQNVCIGREDVVAGKVWLYRIPSPHPHPKEHPLIIVHEFDGKPAPAGSYASICQNLHGNPIYEYVPGDGSQTMATSGAGITRWEPATIVPKAESNG